eukprot:IDg159t1
MRLWRCALTVIAAAHSRAVVSARTAASRRLMSASEGRSVGSGGGASSATVRGLYANALCATSTAMLYVCTHIEHICTSARSDCTPGRMLTSKPLWRHLRLAREQTVSHEDAIRLLEYILCFHLAVYYGNLAKQFGFMCAVSYARCNWHADALDTITSERDGLDKVCAPSLASAQEPNIIYS